MDRSRHLPPWFCQPVPRRERVEKMKDSFEALGIHTVCQSSHCPNLGRCWEQGTATFMILGGVCTRACRFCAVPSGSPKPVNDGEPEAVAEAVKRLGLDHAVVTSVTRDDLDDQGAAFFVRTIQAIRRRDPRIKVEVLVPDFFGKKEIIASVAQALPEVMAHNIETVRRLTPVLRPQADYARSLSVLKTIKEAQRSVVVKSGMMLGLGETPREVKETMQELYDSGCDLLTIGQYLAPSKAGRHVRVERFPSLQEFADHEHHARAIGFKHVVSAPLVRSSYLAHEAYQACARPERELSLAKACA